MQRELPTKAPEARIDGFLIAKHVSGGRETILGMTSDPAFGPVLMFGLGGIYVEALGDVAFGVHPLTETDAQEMIQSIRGRAILEGMRGEAAVDTAAIAEALQRLSQLISEHPRINEVDMNPCLAFEGGLVAVDARVAMTAPEHSAR
jgi:acetyltransferase